MKSCPTCRRKFVDEQQECPIDNARLFATEGPLPSGLGRDLGTYRLVGLLGEGGMGNIYIAAHVLLNRYVAVKVLRPELANRRELVARFFEEARTVNQIKHPNIVESIDMVEDPSGAYTVLELLRGPDLKTRLAAGPVASASVARIGAQIADALSAVHAQGIVHRDLKPENLVLLAQDGRDDFVKLIDFGVAQIAHEGESDAPYGTAAYMAPEQAAGKRVDGRADVYALGVLLFEMATGRHPFPSTSDHEYIMRHADEKPPRPSATSVRCPRAFDDVILRCLAKSPDERYPNAGAVAIALRTLDLRRTSRGGAGRWIASAVVIGGLAAAAVILVPRYLQTSTQQASAEPAPHANAPALPPTAPPAPAPKPAPAPSPAAPDPTPAAATPGDAVNAPGANDRPIDPVTNTAAGSAASASDPLPTAPTADSTVALDIGSTPAGATVFRAGETIPLGVTPFTATLLRSDKAAQLRFEHAGYETRVTAVKVDESHEVTVELVRKATTPGTAVSPQRPGKPEGTKPVQRDGVMDSFSH